MNDRSSALEHAARLGMNWILRRVRCSKGGIQVESHLKTPPSRLLSSSTVIPLAKVFQPAPHFIKLKDFPNQEYASDRVADGDPLLMREDDPRMILIR